MPSKAMFTIPDRSENIPAKAAKIRGVATRNVASKIRIKLVNAYMDPPRLQDIFDHHVRENHCSHISGL
ncbi:hypothetical protein QWZ13_01360 [Reinekea marina]|uniref:hypothetical protein n=1 Tax=Reinekea marina TaxID=1310421 RepID=UPI0025B3E6E6|nr:hypothetical protein [Reinekea marina]MDN3647551.1 hypothetical protein [Reinekea marina]